MKFSSATKTLALAAVAACAATASADLTPFNTTYDLFVADQLLTLGAATDVVVDTHDLWLLDAFAPFVDKFETALTEAAHDGPYYWDLLTGFFDDAAKHDTTYKDLSKKVSSYDQPPMAYAPRSWTDATFAVFKAVLPAEKDKAPTVTGWADTPITWQQLYDSERKAIDALVNTTDRDTIRVTARMERLSHKLFTDEFLGRKFSHAWACADKRMRDAYHHGSGVDPRLSCSDVPEFK